jgi:hypothetical protein
MHFSVNNTAILLITTAKNELKWTKLNDIKNG